jgi:peroxiredoxin
MRKLSAIIRAGGLVHLCTVLAALLLFPACSTDQKHRLSTGDVLPPFTAQDITGETISLAAYKDSPVIVRFFLVDCKFCLADTPSFNAFHEKYRDKGLKVVYINNDAPDITAVKNFVRKLNIPFPVIFDPQGTIAAQYNIRAQPLTLLLDARHRVLAALLGGVSAEELESIMAPVLHDQQK